MPVVTRPVKERLAEIAETLPAASRLAELLSVAVRLEPALIREIRLALFPGSHADLEAELYFSPLISQRTADWLALEPQFATEFRKQLARRIDKDENLRQHLNVVQEILNRAHAGAPFEIRREEEILRISVWRRGGKKQAVKDIERELRQMLNLMLAETDQSLVLARWFATAAQRLPPLAHQTQSFALLAFAVNGLLGVRRIDPKGIDLEVKAGHEVFETLAGYFSRPARRTRQAKLYAALTAKGLSLRAGEAKGYVEIQVPLMDPTLLDVRPSTGAGRLVQWRPGESLIVPMSSGPVVLRTLLGEEVRFRPSVPRPPQPEAGRKQRPALRIFIASTAIDLRDYPARVRDAVLRLEGVPVAMETFSAQSGQPAQESMRLAAEADAVICIVAHRYGYVPPVVLGGDGERSITWLEVDAAKRAGKPVFAFLVDPKAPWTAAKEHDRLLSEPEKAQEIVEAVQKLQEFKAYLEREYRQTFTGPEDLDAKVTAALANFASAQGQAAASSARVWHPLFCHALQPGRHFRGREAELQELKQWLQAPVTPDRVISLVGAGGSGKTALVYEALHQTTQPDAGLFVWSFYEDPHTDAFLRQAYLYFTGEKDTPAGGMLERLQLALSGDAPHVLVLDGLERVQSEGGHSLRGELEDLQLKRLMRVLAGGVGGARALVTSRFPLVDLDPFTGAGHRAIVLDDLERAVALEVLRAWGVKGDDATLARLIDALNAGGRYHALSVAVLGSYIANFGGGNPEKAREFSLADVGESEPMARRLSRILDQYAKVLAPAERDLLARLSLFPRGVTVEFLGWIAQAGGDVAGALISLADRQLVRHLERLTALGLVYRYESDRQAVYSAHPFLRDFFRNLLGTSPEAVHDSVRARLASRLEANPRTMPRDQATLDQYELLIEQTLRAGRVQEAFELYWSGLGGYANLGFVLGEYGRGLRILERFVPGDEFFLIEPDLPLSARSALVSDLALFARNLGNLARAREALRHALNLSQGKGDRKEESIRTVNLAGIELDAGNFRQALDYSESALSLAKAEGDAAATVPSLVHRAASHFALGNTEGGTADFRSATPGRGLSLSGTYGIWEAECKLLRGDRAWGT
jgi:tetratricopeptide (TPR) repeat protein